MARVVIHQNEDGAISVFSDPDIDVFWVDERSPEDRTYKMDPRDIPPDLVDEQFGTSEDGSAASIRAERAVNAMEGKSHLSVVEPSDVCKTCLGNEWVCENHRDRPSGITSLHPSACDCGPGVPCPDCSPLAQH